MNADRKPGWVWRVAAAVVIIDAAAKLAARFALTPGHVVHVSSLISLDLYYNHAGAGNSFTGRPVFVSLLSIAAIIGLIAIASRTRSRGFGTGIGLLLGGGIGNLADRIFGSPGPLRGGVIDWLRLFHSQGSMNLADLAINLGLVVLALSVLVEWWTARRGARSTRPGTEATVSGH